MPRRCSLLLSGLFRTAELLNLSREFAAGFRVSITVNYPAEVNENEKACQSHRLDSEDFIHQLLHVASSII